MSLPAGNIVSNRMIEILKIAEGLGAATGLEVAAAARVDKSNIYKHLNFAVTLGLMKKSGGYRDMRFTAIAGWEEVATKKSPVATRVALPFRFARVNSVFDMGDQARAE